jgi:hypothetical protein
VSTNGLTPYFFRKLLLAEPFVADGRRRHFERLGEENLGRQARVERSIVVVRAKARARPLRRRWWCRLGRLRITPLPTKLATGGRTSGGAEAAFWPGTPRLFAADYAAD